jgi:hypothetical protein
VTAGRISIRTDDHQRDIIILWRRAVIGVHRLQQLIAQLLRRDVVVEAHDLAQQRQSKNSASVYHKLMRREISVSAAPLSNAGVAKFPNPQ